MKRLWILAFVVCSVGCALQGGTINNPFKPPQLPPANVFCAAPSVHDQAGHPLAGAAVSIGGLSGVSRSDGYVYLEPIPAGTQMLTVTLDGYLPYSGDYQIDSWHCDIPVILTLAHVDPSTFTLDQLAAFRGAMWPQGLGLPGGPRPGAPDNIIATDFFADYSPADQQRILAWEKAQGYTHVVVGPIVDSDGYHGIWIPNDWRTKFDQFLDILQTFWDNGQAPVIFIHPDGWTLEQTKALTPLFQSARAQTLMRIIIPSGWEPSKYSWSSCTWAGYVSWARATWPNALVGIHTVADVDAPVGTDALCDDNGKPNGEGWQRVADAGLHVWLVQNGAYTTSPSDNPSLAYSFAAQFSTGADGAATHGAAWHFANGVASWPTNSGWGNTPIRMINAEATSYTAFWSHLSEEARKAWGDLCLTKDACGGFLDGGTGR